MWRLFFTRTAGGRVAANVARGLAAAVIAGIGWKLGADAYDATKRRIARSRKQNAR